MLLYIATRLPYGGSGPRDHVPCEYFQNNGVTGILMYILKTFLLIHFQFCLLKNTDIE